MFKVGDLVTVVQHRKSNSSKKYLGQQGRITSVSSGFVTLDIEDPKTGIYNDEIVLNAPAHGYAGTINTSSGGSGPPQQIPFPFHPASPPSSGAYNQLPPVNPFLIPAGLTPPSSGLDLAEGFEKLAAGILVDIMRMDEKKCECGVDSVGGGKHSDYCPKSKL